MNILTESANLKESASSTTNFLIQKGSVNETEVITNLITAVVNELPSLEPITYPLSEEQIVNIGRVVGYIPLKNIAKNQSTTALRGNVGALQDNINDLVIKLISKPLEERIITTRNGATIFLDSLFSEGGLLAPLDFLI
eukprot:Awhi_evm1s5119